MWWSCIHVAGDIIRHYLCCEHIAVWKICYTRRLRYFKIEFDFVGIICSCTNSCFCVYMYLVYMRFYKMMCRHATGVRVVICQIRQPTIRKIHIWYGQLKVRLTRYQGVLWQWSYVTVYKSSPPPKAMTGTLTRPSHVGSNERCFLTFAESHAKSHFKWYITVVYWQQNVIYVYTYHQHHDRMSCINSNNKPKMFSIYSKDHSRDQIMYCKVMFTFLQNCSLRLGVITT